MQFSSVSHQNCISHSFGDWWFEARVSTCMFGSGRALIWGVDFLMWPHMIEGVQFSSVAQSCPTLWDSMNCSTPGLHVHHQLPESTQTHVHWIGDAIQPSYPLSSPSPPGCNLSQYQGLFQWVRWPKYWRFSFNISPSNEHSGLISSRMDWVDLLAVQGTLKSLLQNHSSKASFFWHSAFFIVQFSHPYMT